MLQMVHPDRVVDEKGFADLPLVEPVYPLTEGLALGNVRRAMDARADAHAGHCRNGRTKPGSRASAFPPSPRRCAICTGRRRRTTFCPKPGLDAACL